MVMSESDAETSSLPPPPPPLPHATSPQRAPHGSKAKGKSNPLEGRIQMPVRRGSTNSGRSQPGSSSVSVPINHPSSNSSPVLMTRGNQWSPSSEPSTPPITDTFEPIFGARRRRWKCWVITGMTVVALILAAMFGFYLAGQRQIFLRHFHEHHHLHDQNSTFTETLSTSGLEGSPNESPGTGGNNGGVPPEKESSILTIPKASKLPSGKSQGNLMEAMMEGDHKAINQLKRSSPGELTEAEIAELGNGEVVPEPASVEEEESDEEHSEEVPSSPLEGAEPAVPAEAPVGEVAPVAPVQEVPPAAPVEGAPATEPVQEVPAEAPLEEVQALPAEPAPIAPEPASGEVVPEPPQQPDLPQQPVPAGDVLEVPAEEPLPPSDLPENVPAEAIPAEETPAAVGGTPIETVPPELGEIPEEPTHGETIPVEEPAAPLPAEAPPAEEIISPGLTPEEVPEMPVGAPEPAEELIPPPELPDNTPAEVNPAEEPHSAVGGIPDETMPSELGEIPEEPTPGEILPVEGSAAPLPAGEMPVEEPPLEALSPGEVPEMPVGAPEPAEELIPPPELPENSPAQAIPAEEPPSAVGGIPVETVSPEFEGIAQEPTSGETLPVEGSEAPLPADALPAPELPVGGLPAGDVPVGGSPVGGLPVGGSPVEGLPAGDVPIGELPAGDVPVGGLPVGGSPVGGLPVEGSPVGGLPAGDVPVEGLPAGDVPVGGLPVGGSPVGGLPVGGSPVGGLPAGDVPVGGLPVGESPVGGLPAGDVPVGGLPVGGSPVGGLPAGDVPVEGLPVGGSPVGGLPAGDVPVGGLPAQPEFEAVPEAPLDVAGPEPISPLDNEVLPESDLPLEPEVLPASPAEGFVDERVGPVEGAPVPFGSPTETFDEPLQPEEVPVDVPPYTPDGPQVPADELMLEPVGGAYQGAPDYPAVPEDQDIYDNNEVTPPIDSTQPGIGQEPAISEPQGPVQEFALEEPAEFPAYEYPESLPEQPIAAQDYPMASVPPPFQPVPTDETQFVPIEDFGGNPEYSLEPAQEIEAFPGEETPFQPSGLQSPPLTAADLVFQTDALGNYPAPAELSPSPVDSDAFIPVEQPIEPSFVEENAAPQTNEVFIDEGVSPYEQAPEGLVEPVPVDLEDAQIIERADPLGTPTEFLEEGPPDQEFPNAEGVQPPIGNDNLPPGLVPDISSFPEGPLPVDDSQELQSGPPVFEDVSMEEPGAEMGYMEVPPEVAVEYPESVSPVGEVTEFSEPGVVSPAEADKLGGGFGGSLEGDEHLTAGQRRAAAYGNPSLLQSPAAPPVKEVPLSLFPSRMLSKLNHQEGMPVLFPHAGLQNEVPTRQPASVFVPEGTIATPALILETLPKTLQESFPTPFASSPVSEIPNQFTPVAAQVPLVETIQPLSPVPAVSPPPQTSPLDGLTKIFPGLSGLWPRPLRNPYKPLQPLPPPQPMPQPVESTPQIPPNPQPLQPVPAPHQTEPSAPPTANHPSMPHQAHRSVAQSPFNHPPRTLQHPPLWSRNLFNPRQMSNLEPNPYLTRLMPSSRQVPPTAQPQESQPEPYPSPVPASSPETKEPLSQTSPQELAAPKPALHKPLPPASRRELIRNMQRPNPILPASPRELAHRKNPALSSSLSPTARRELASQRSPQNPSAYEIPSAASRRNLSDKPSILRPFSPGYHRELAQPNLYQNRPMFQTYPFRPMQIGQNPPQHATINPHNSANMSNPISRFISQPKHETSIAAVPKKPTTLRSLSPQPDTAPGPVKPISSNPPSPKVALPEHSKSPAKPLSEKLAKLLTTPDKRPEPKKLSPLSVKIEKPKPKPKPKHTPASLSKALDEIEKPRPAQSLVFNPKLRRDSSLANRQGLDPLNLFKPQPQLDVPRPYDPIRELAESKVVQSTVPSQVISESTPRPPVKSTSETLPVREVPPKFGGVVSNKVAMPPPATPIQKTPVSHKPAPQAPVSNKVVSVPQPKPVEQSPPSKPIPTHQAAPNKGVSSPQPQPAQPHSTPVKSPAVPHKQEYYVPLKYLSQPFHVPYSPNYEVRPLRAVEPELPFSFSAPSQYIPLFINRHQNPNRHAEKAVPARVASPMHPVNPNPYSAEHLKSVSQPAQNVGRPVQVVENAAPLSNECAKSKVAEKPHVSAHQPTEVPRASPNRNPNPVNHSPKQPAETQVARVASPPANTQKQVEAVNQPLSSQQYFRSPYTWTEGPQRYLSSNNPNAPIPMAYLDRHMNSPFQVSPPLNNPQVLTNFLQRIPYTWVRPVLNFANQNQWPGAH